MLGLVPSKTTMYHNNVRKAMDGSGQMCSRGGRGWTNKRGVDRKRGEGTEKRGGGGMKSRGGRCRKID